MKVYLLRSEGVSIDLYQKTFRLLKQPDSCIDFKSVDEQVIFPDACLSWKMIFLEISRFREKKNLKTDG